MYRPATALLNDIRNTRLGPTSQTNTILIVLACCFAIFILASCSNKAQQHEYTIFAFGTLIEITLYDVDKKSADEVFTLLQSNYDQYHQDWSPWTEGDLAQLNQKLKRLDSATRVPPHLLPIIERSLELSEISEGLFNPAIGELINLWQFHRYREDDIRPPDAAAIAVLLRQKPGMDDLTLTDGGQIRNSNPALSLNFGAFAKGYAIGQSMKRLKEAGINNAIINAGGDLSVIGQHSERAWNIGIRHPGKDTILASIEVADGESVFTSGDYERYYYFDNRRYHHILDPRTGYPTHDARSVTVIHEDPGLADAAATALFVAGRDDWGRIAEKMGIRYVMLIDADDVIHLTSEMKDRMQLLEKDPSRRIIVNEEL